MPKQIAALTMRSEDNNTMHCHTGHHRNWHHSQDGHSAIFVTTPQSGIQNHYNTHSRQPDQEQKKLWFFKCSPGSHLLGRKTKYRIAMNGLVYPM